MVLVQYKNLQELLNRVELVLTDCRLGMWRTVQPNFFVPALHMLSNVLYEEGLCRREYCLH